MSEDFLAVQIIQKKKRGERLSKNEIYWLIQSYTSGSLPDYQMSAWAMAVYFNGLNDSEVSDLTAAMRDSGDKFNFSHLNSARLDKHSTGGVGDKTSLIIGPIWAAAKVFTPMIAGRGLGHTGGTLDKLESLPGFNIHLSPKEFKKNVEKHFFSLMGQTPQICPADRKLYALRDVTATVDSIPLICASIMSKKLAEDLSGLVLDIKYGTGAFMKTPEQARELATKLVSIGKSNGVPTRALLTDMNQPLGRFAGNSLEVLECYEILSGHKKIENNKDFYANTRELSLILAGHGLHLAKKAETSTAGYQLAQKILESGAALQAFESLCEYQGPASIRQLPLARQKQQVSSPKKGFITKIDAEKIGMALVELGAGRKKTDDQIDPSAGFEFHAQLGDFVEVGQPLVTIHLNLTEKISDIQKLILNSYEFSDAAPKPLPLVLEMIG